MYIKSISLIDSKNKAKFNFNFKNYKYSYFNALLGLEHKSEFQRSLFMNRYRREPRNGEIGCTLSHYNLIKELANSDIEHMIILEDDALPTEHFNSFIMTNELYNQEPAVVLLGHSKTRKKDLFLQRLKQPLMDKILIGGHLFGKNNRITECGTVAYYINKKAAEIIANYKKPYWLADDWHFFIDNGIKVYHPLIPLVYEDLTSVSTTGNIIYLNHSFKNKPIRQVLSIIKSQLLFYSKSILRIKSIN